MEKGKAVCPRGALRVEQSPTPTMNREKVCIKKPPKFMNFRCSKYVIQSRWLSSMSSLCIHFSTILSMIASIRRTSVNQDYLY